LLWADISSPAAVGAAVVQFTSSEVDLRLLIASVRS